MKSKSHYVRERCVYSKESVAGFFAGENPTHIDLLLEKLKQVGILREMTKPDKKKLWSELADDLGGIEAESESLYKAYIFDFVGVVCLGGYVFKCYPKYMKPGIQPLEELKQIIQVIEKASSKSQDIRSYEHIQDSDVNNLLSLMLFMLDDYYANGIYRNELDTLETNGAGEINWDKTINETYPIISHGQPYYVEMFTKKRIRDDSDFFYRLHCAILTKISKELAEAELAELLGIVTVDLSEEELEDFGDIEYIVERIEKELRVQFNTHKQMLLRAMQDYITEQSSLHDDGILVFYGTNSFHTIWEAVCADVFGNVLNGTLSQVAENLGIPLANQYKDKASCKLKDLMPKPMWNWPTTKNKIEVNDTLRLDLVSAYNDKGISKFIIFDAKYYTPQMVGANKLSKVPGIADVTKQYFYQLAFMPFLTDHNVKYIRNCFLMPMQYYYNPKGDFQEQGNVEIGIFHQPLLESVALQNIQVRFLPPVKVFECYLAGKTYCIDELNL